MLSQSPSTPKKSVPVGEPWSESDNQAGTNDRRQPRSDKNLPPHTEEVVTLSDELANSWLAWQCQMVSGVIRGAIFPPGNKDKAEVPIASWNEDGTHEEELYVICKEVIAESQGSIHAHKKYGDGMSTCDYIGCPLVADDSLVGVVVLMISTRSKSQQHAVLQLLQWGGIWVEKLVQNDLAKHQEFGTYTVALVMTALEIPAVKLTTLEIVNRLADRFHCERVSLGIRNGISIKIQALSHATKFDARTQLVRRIEAAMEESVDQMTTINFNGNRRDDKRTENVDNSSVAVVNRAHYELSRQQSFGSTCTVVLKGQWSHIGAITFERAANDPFDQKSVMAFETLANILGPILEIKLRDERHFVLKGMEALRELAGEIFGPAHLKLKIFAMTALLVLALTSLFNGMHRVTSPATIEGAVRRMLVAPHEGYIKIANARAGDEVSEGQIIAELDDSELTLELRKWLGEKNKLQKVYQEALALRDRTKLSVTMAQVEQIEAEISLVENRIERTRLKAPFKGVIVSGDFSQSLGAPVEKGQILFEVAPLDSYVVVLEVDEFDVANLEVGKTGRLIIAALPQATFGVTVSKIVPVAIASGGRNYFRVEAELDEGTRLLRPGMQGVAKIEMGERTLLWIWTHSIVDRLRLWAWSAGL